jgi:3-hydroxyacyl-[acyl-carrier-protein] dehydratase
MLEGLFDIQLLEDQGQKQVYKINVNATHHVFDGHFPGQPVLPGVAMVYLSRALTQKQVSARALQMNGASQIKFLSLVDPRINAEFIYVNEILKNEAGVISVKGDMKHGETTFFKINATYNS